MDNNKENSTYAPVPIIEDKVDKNIMKTPLSSDDSLARSDVEDGQPSPSPRRNRKTDPFYFICKRFGFPMLGNNYILRTTDDGDLSYDRGAPLVRHRVHHGDHPLRDLLPGAPGLGPPGGPGGHRVLLRLQHRLPVARGLHGPGDRPAGHGAGRGGGGGGRAALLR
ncbi:unnamed protein product [Heterosigma akashiwo]